MKRSRLQVPFVVAATALFLVVSLNPTPSDTAPSAPDRFPGGLGERQELRELAAAAREPAGEPASGPRKLQAFTPRTLDAALAAKPHDFELFTSERDDEARRKLLQRLPYGGAILRAARRHEVDGLLLAAMVETESRFSASAVSPRGAVGLMQILPATGQLYGAQDLLDPYVNLDVGSRYLRSLLREYHGDLDRVLAAYNAGPAVVSRYGGVPPFRETRDYVSRVRSRYAAHCEEVRKSLLPAAEPAVAAGEPSTRALPVASFTPKSGPTFLPKSGPRPESGLASLFAPGTRQAIRAR
jgi:soluble lytic murein transglycosylase-like protein